jgi:preprotein translocase subunit SecG
MWYYLLMILLFLVGVFLILLILVQRGKGGGLAGALGGLGGQSAFGSKAGDTFTKVTVVTATFWILLCILGVKYLGAGRQSLLQIGDRTTTGQSTAPDGKSGTLAGKSGTLAGKSSTPPKTPEKTSEKSGAAPVKSEPAKGAEKSKQ